MTAEKKKAAEVTEEAEKLVNDAVEPAEEKKSATKKTASKKAPAKKAPAKKPAAKKTAAKSDDKPAEKKKAAAPKKKAAAPKKKTAKSKKKQQLKITQVKSQIGYAQAQRKVLTGLGLGRIGRTVVRVDNPSIRGMVSKVSHLVSVEEVEA
jgi:large subunit ribosomal protein L30